MRRATVLALLMSLGSIVPAASAAKPVFGGWAEPAEELPHLEALHEWWYFAVQSSGAGPCGAWQAMVTLLRDAEAASDRLLFTTIVDGAPADRSLEHLPGTMGYAITEDVPTSEYIVTLGDSHLTVGRFDGTRRVHAVSGSATLDVALRSTTEDLWRRRVPEGAGVLEIILAPRATVSGSLTIGSIQCPVSGLGYFEHVWGTWSRVPMWGVDFLSAHAGPWSVVARRTPMRGEDRGFPTNALAKPVVIVTDGSRVYESAGATFEMSESGSHPELGLPIPTSYQVTGTGFDAPGPGSVRLTVSEPTLATILLPVTSSGILEGWANADLLVDGVSHAGTSEVEWVVEEILGRAWSRRQFNAFAMPGRRTAPSSR